jgi:hypothetical protein
MLHVLVSLRLAMHSTIGWGRLVATLLHVFYMISDDCAIASSPASICTQGVSVRVNPYDCSAMTAAPEHSVLRESALILAYT